MKPLGLVAAGVSIGVMLGVGLGFGFWAAPDDPESRSVGDAVQRAEPQSPAAATREPPPPRETAEARLLALELDLLRAKLVAEVERRRALERELLAMAAAGVDAESLEVAPEPVSEPVVESAPKEKPRVPGDPWIDDDVLLRAGFDQSEIDEVRGRFEAIELERLYLRDQATREKWLGTRRFRKETRGLDRVYDEIRGDIGDDDYDWFLYASGEKNGVLAKRVIAGSQAELIGLEAGDVVIKYEGTRILTGADLQRETTRGRDGDVATLDIERDGESMRFYLPVGPIGIQFEPVRRMPKHPH